MATIDDKAGSELPAIVSPGQHSPALLPGALTRAASDADFIELWLRRPNLSDDTRRNGRKEVTRFLMWCRTNALTFDAVRYEHLLNYSEFLANPQPAADWISPHKYRRSDPLWRPFLAPLKPRSHLQALIILKSFFSWADAARYISQNPAKLLGRLAPDLPNTVERYLPLTAVPYLAAAADLMPTERPTQLLRQARARFIMAAYYDTAVRLAELVGASMNSFRQDDKGRWWLHVLGKGKRAGKVPVPPSTLSALAIYREAFGLKALPAYDDELPLLLATRGKLRRASHTAIARTVKLLMRHAAELASREGEGALASRIGRASTHWLRHSQLTHQADAGMPLKTVQLNGRHADIKTTGMYLHKEDDVRHAETLAGVGKIQRS